MDDYDMKDSGQRQEFPTGAVRDTQSGKGRYDLLPVVALKRVAAVYEKGAQKYSDHNWTLGIPASRFMDSALRHLMQYSEGHRDEDHLAQAAFNVLGLIHTESMVERGNLPASLMDLPSYVQSASPESRQFVINLKGEIEKAKADYVEKYGIQIQKPADYLPKRKCDDNRHAHPAHTYTKISAAANCGTIQYRCPGASFDRT